MSPFGVQNSKSVRTSFTYRLAIGIQKIRKSWQAKLGEDDSLSFFSNKWAYPNNKCYASMHNLKNGLRSFLKHP